MTIHKSLRIAAGGVKTRNVLRREERLERLTELGRWTEKKDSIFHLPKTRVAGKKIGKKKVKKKEEEAKDDKKGKKK